MLTNDAKAVIALTTRLGSRDRPSLSAKKWHTLSVALQESGHTPSAVFDRSLRLSGLPGIDPELAESVASLVADGTSATLEADDLTRKGIWVTTIVDEDYPQSLISRLQASAPPVLFGVGDKALLTKAGIGVVGSREVDTDGAETAKALAREAVALGKSVVSGGARGADQLAMNAAFSEGGSVVGVLADSLESRIKKPDILDALDHGETCLVTQQAPATGFSPAAAMSRNKLIYALSEVTVVVACDLDSGGTWSGATEALRAGNGVVAVWRAQGQGPGNEKLERLGAEPITSASELPGLLSRPTTPPVEQLTLLD